ncbi:N-formylglutamate amidohydrolase [Roseospira visakhapatnamensis]|uniref:Putative N-formylglutamate amidohydrolase n=1 Tax=Roseospira visakhapatnamensis TaxID=390880 RepID=A0A7W6RB57_9PROT|nr:N-formylglutamate amidohydrolase [Roseospira visakhapatnamensis]MBB4265315.1 putative N-formylglutamate amidohydrolase [Roseospira visakhapatnamensis]
MRARAAVEQSPEDAVVEVINPTGRGPVVLACEHASNAVPADLNALGLSPAALSSHVAWDPGALAVARALAQRLDAPLVAARVSRLVVDCNRPPEAVDAMPAHSEVFAIPGNAALTADERRRRAEAIHHPFHATLASCLDDASRIHGRAPALVTVHSFTPVYNGVPRTLDLGVLHDADARLADALLSAPALGPASGLVVRRNEPYGPADGVTHTLARHGVARGLPHVMLEIRNDRIADEAGQRAWAGRLADAVTRALEALAVAEAVASGV